LAVNYQKEDPMSAINWQQYGATSVEDISPANIEAMLAAAEDGDSELNFDPGEPWDEPFGPTDDDPE
jgi:hypothetical protein